MKPSTPTGWASSTRGEGLRLAALALAAGVLAGASPPVSASGTPGPPPPPNVVVFLADDLGYSDLGSYGGEIETPNLDRLASGGVRFTRFYTTPRCSPSRAALLTGVWPHQAGVGHLNLDFGRPGYRGELSRRALTLAERLRPAGYRTYMAGKWHLSPNPPRNGRPPRQDERRSWPRGRGFDRFYGVLRGSVSYYQPASLVRGETPVEPGPGFYLTDALSEAAVGFLADHFARYPGRRFFLYLAYTAPHWPLHAPEEEVARYAGRFDAGWDELRRERHRRMVEMGLIPPQWPLPPRDPRVPAWEEVRHRSWQARRMEVYAAMVERMDRGVGRVLAALEAAGALDDTLVLFLSDNGACGEGLTGLYRLGAWTLAVPRLTPSGPLRFGDRPGVAPGPEDTFQAYGRGWAQLSNTPFRRYKHHTHEGGILTPLIVHWPAGLGVEPGSLLEAPGHVVDLVPTVLEAAGVEAEGPFADRRPLPLAGQSLLPLLRGGGRQRGPMYWEHEGNRAVRDGRWKLVSRWPRGWELYDLEADGTELEDLAEREPERVAALTRSWEGWAEEAGVEPWPWVVPWVRWLAWGAAGLALLVAGVVRRRRRGSGRAAPPAAPSVLP